MVLEHFFESNRMLNFQKSPILGKKVRWRAEYLVQGERIVRSYLRQV